MHISFLCHSSPAQDFSDFFLPVLENFLSVLALWISYQHISHAVGGVKLLLAEVGLYQQLIGDLLPPG